MSTFLVRLETCNCEGIVDQGRVWIKEGLGMLTMESFMTHFTIFGGEGRNEERVWSCDRAGVGLPGQHTGKGRGNMLISR